MASCEFTQPLLENEQCPEYSYYDNEASCEDSSSGYDSNEASDVESEALFKPRGIQIPTKAAHTDHVSARVKSTHALCESLKLIVDMPEMCDVTFLVGPSETPVHGVRAILGTRSRVFYQLIIQHLGMREAKLKSSKPSPRTFDDRLIIHVRKYDSEVFRMLVQFVHCGSATITDTTVSGLLCGADQFELRDLEQACWEFIDRRIEDGCGDTILQATRAYSHHKMSAEICSAILAMTNGIPVNTTGYVAPKSAS